MPGHTRAIVRPLIVTSDEQQLDDVLRLAAASGAEVDVVPDAGLARSRWVAAPLVVVGDDQAAALSAMSLPRRPGVVVVSSNLQDLAAWRHGVALGADRVIGLPDGQTWLVDRFADVVEGGTGHGVVIGVIGGRGGAGASVLATSLALNARAPGRSVMLVDADPLGGGLDLALGAEEVRGLRWPDLAHTRGRLAGTTLREHLPTRHGLTVLSWDRGDVVAIPPESVRAVMAAARRACDVVVVDLPRRVDAAAEEVVAGCRCLLLVVPAEVRAVAAAGRVASVITQVTGDVRLVVRGPAPGGLRAGEVATALGLPLAAQTSAEPRLAESLERGEPPGRSGKGPLVGACRQLLHDLLAESASPAA